MLECVYDLLFLLSSHFVTAWRRCRHCSIRSFPNLYPSESMASCLRESRHFSEFPYVFSLLRVFYAFFSSDVPLFRILSLVFAYTLVFTLILSVSLTSPLISVLSGITVHPHTTSSLTSTISVTFCDTNGTFLFWIRPYFPQWALAHQVRVSYIFCLL